MKKELKKYGAMALAAFFVYLAIHYWPAATRLLEVAWRGAAPLILGCVLAYILNILMSFYEKHYFPKSKKTILRKSARPVCMLAAMLTLALILALVLQLVLPELASCVELLFAEVPDAMKRVADWLAGFAFVPEEILTFLQGVDWQAALIKIADFLTSGIGSVFNFAMEAVSSVVSFVMDLVIGLIFAVYLLSGKEKLRIQCRRMMEGYITPRWNEKIQYVLAVTNNCFHKYIVCQCVEAVILGALCAVGMVIFGFPYAVMTGVVIGVTALIPIAGAYIGGAVGFLLILSSDSFTKALLFVVYLLILQQLEGNLIYPRVVGSSIGLPGIWVLAAVTIGGGIAGIPGMLLGVPLAAVAYRLLQNNLNQKEKTDAIQKADGSGA